ncbi:unnamed protein product, partial [Porites lobata]
ERGKRKAERGNRKEEGGKRKEERGKRKKEKGKRKAERGKRKLRKAPMSQNMVSSSEPSANQTLDLRLFKAFQDRLTCLNRRMIV